MTETIRLATRESKLALWQAEYVKHQLEAAHSDLRVEIVGMTTLGDRNKHSPLSKLGGKGVFVKELETGLLDGSVDIAVHSMKDVPGVLPDGLAISAICEREDPRDALLSLTADTFEDLQVDARVGSSSLRRRYQLQQVKPELNYLDLRGNVETRLRKLDEGEYEAIVLAVAGLKRLGLEHRITARIPVTQCVPAAGQGAVGIESRIGDHRISELLAKINHVDTYDCVMCEREISIGLGASCNMPLAAFAQLDANRLRMQCYVASVDGSRHLSLSESADRGQAITMARGMVQALTAQGVLDMIDPGQHF